MPNITVSPASVAGKYKVSINYIQEGIEYSSEEIANSQADKLRNKYTENLNL